MGENPGTRVNVEGLNHDVMDDDIKELFAGVGDLHNCAVRTPLVIFSSICGAPPPLPPLPLFMYPLRKSVRR